jgi:hypothetical protein
VTQGFASSSSAQFHVLTDSPTGLLFRSKRDRRVINVSPDISSQTEAAVGGEATREDVITEEYLQVVFFDLTTKKK